MKKIHNTIKLIIAATQTKWIRSALIALALSVAVLGVTGCKESAPKQGAEKSVQYTCSMHPEVVKDAPGDCPKCGMKLVEKR